MMLIGFVLVIIVTGVIALALRIHSKQKPKPVFDPNATPLPVAGESRKEFMLRCTNNARMQELYPDVTARMKACDLVYAQLQPSGEIYGAKK